MFDYERVVQDLQDKGYTSEDIEEYIRREVDRDKNEKYDELDKVKLTFFAFLIGLVSVETFEKEVNKIIKEPNRDYSQVKKMIEEINPDYANKVFKEPKKNKIEKLKFSINDFDEKKARKKWSSIFWEFLQSRTQHKSRPLTEGRRYSVHQFSK